MVEAVKRSKTAARWSGGMPGAIVVDDKHGGAVPGPQVDGHMAGRVAGGVVEDVRDHLTEQDRLGGDLGGDDVGHGDGQVWVALADRADVLSDEVVDVDALRRKATRRCTPAG